MSNQNNINNKKNNLGDKPLPDQDLWLKIRSGDRESFASLFNNYYQQLYQFAGRFVQDTQTAENIVQDLFVKLWIDKDKIQIKSALKSYLYTATKNRSLTTRKRALNQIPSEKHSSQEQETAGSPEDDYILNETYLAVQKAVANLPERCRLVYQMKRFDNLHYSEISEILNISVNTVKTQLQRALKSLEKQLTPFIK
jgi:RNA polymerase sigma-70 factor (ECF subfamily)